MKKIKFLVLTFLFAVFSYAQVPTITGISTYSAVPGSVVTISGYNFSATPASNIVWFQTVRGTVLSATTTQLDVRVPYGSSYGQITITVGGLTGYSPFDFTPTFYGATTPTNIFSTTTSSFYFGPGTSKAYISNIIDLDLDGRPDIVSTYAPNGTIGASAQDSAIMIFRNNISPAGTVSASTFPLVKFLKSPIIYS